jgi:hypothetical protein
VSLLERKPESKRKEFNSFRGITRKQKKLSEFQAAFFICIIWAAEKISSLLLFSRFFWALPQKNQNPELSLVRFLGQKPTKTIIYIFAFQLFLSRNIGKNYNFSFFLLPSASDYLDLISINLTV